MASPGLSPKRRRLKLSRMVKEENNCEDTKPNRTSKANSSNNEVDPKAKNFMKACLKVSYDAFKDCRKRFQLIYLPECINSICNHGDRNANFKQISQSAEQTFNTEIKTNTWYEALEICLICMTTCQYLSPNVLKNIVEIMMNAHEDLNTGYTIDYILRKCQHTLMIHFNMHPPCVTKCIRECYKTFLTSPMEKKKRSNRQVYLSDEGIVAHCFSRLKYEISVESSNGTLIEEEEIPLEIEGVKRLHWKKENLELFELLQRNDRIERCMFVLESIIYLLQTDIALWHARLVNTGMQQRSQRPLLAYLLWPYNCLKYGTVTIQCHKIMELFVYFIHLQYPERHIKTMSLWMNAIAQMFYMCDMHCGVDYPNISPYYSVLAKEFYKIIAPLPNTSISRILDKIQPSFMQHLIGVHHIQTILNFTQSDILCIIIWCVKNLVWDNYPAGNQGSTVYKKSSLKPHKLLHYLSRKCKSFSATDLVTDAYPKFVTMRHDNQVEQDYIINILFTTFVAYLETYSIKNFNQTLESYNENKDDCDPTSYKSYKVTDCFVKKYRSIIQYLQQLMILIEKHDKEPLRKLYDLINVYFS